MEEQVYSESFYRAFLVFQEIYRDKTWEFLLKN